MTTLVGVGGAVLTLIGVLVGNGVARRGDKEADRWRRREETMRLLRWAVESATSSNELLADAGLAVLDELVEAELLQPEDKRLVQAVVHVVTRTAGILAYADHSDRDYSEVPRLVRRVEADDD